LVEQFKINNRGGREDASSVSMQSKAAHA
jgi:hypothetical protein